MLCKRSLRSVLDFKKKSAFRYIFHITTTQSLTKSRPILPEDIPPTQFCPASLWRTVLPALLPHTNQYGVSLR